MPPQESCIKKVAYGTPKTPTDDSFDTDNLIIGDLANLEDDEQERQLDNFRLGILRAAASHDALIVDSGLASGMACAAPTEVYADYCKKFAHLVYRLTRLKTLVAISYASVDNIRLQSLERPPR